jgi:predicted acylesterase/phospholipase RssA
MCDNPDTLVFKGAGIKGISYIGVIRYYEEIGHNQIKVYSGSSSGSFISLMAILGYTSSEMLSEFVQTTCAELLGNINSSSIPNLTRTIWTGWRLFGMTDGKAFEEKIKMYIEKKTKNPLITFLELYQLTGKTLIVTGTCLNTDKVEYFNWRDTPNFPVYKAIRISQTLPPIISPVILTIKRELNVENIYCDDELLYSNQVISDFLPETDTFEKWYVDGGLLDNYPIEYTCKFIGSQNTVIGFDIDTLHGGQPNDKITQYRTISRKWPWDYIKSAIFAQHIELDRISKKCISTKMVPIIVDDIDIYSFDLTSSQIQKLYQDGYNSIKKYYSNLDNSNDDDSLFKFEKRININTKPNKRPGIDQTQTYSGSEWDTP